MEVLNLSELPGYRTGGTIHVVVNNQIGFTTPPAERASTPYATDIARMLEVPILHVNGEDPARGRRGGRAGGRVPPARSTRDVVIDMYCYRKHGHNEGDEPSFTQPQLYERSARTDPREVYARRMLERGEIAQAEIDRIFNESKERIERSLNEAGDYDPYLGRIDSEVGKLWSNYKGSLADPVDTRVPADKLRAIIVEANTVPEGMHAHRKIERLLAERNDATSRLEVITIAGPVPSRVSRSHTVNPSRSGRATSRSTTSGCSKRLAASAEFPSAASPTTSNPSASNTARASLRKPA